MLKPTSRMPYGRYKGMLLMNVPRHHLLWMYDNGLCTCELEQFVEDYLKQLKGKVTKKLKKKRNDPN